MSDCLDMSKAERLLSYSLLSLITSKPLASSSSSSESADHHVTTSIAKGLVNEEGAWCWREKCAGAVSNQFLQLCHSFLTQVLSYLDCLKLTKAIQKTSETLQNVADLYDDHARRTQLSTHESMKTMAHPEAIYEVNQSLNYFA
jgi:sorting nexin-9/18/33